MNINYNGRTYRILQLTHFCIHLECVTESHAGEKIYIPREVVEKSLRFQGIGTADTFSVNYDIPAEENFKNPFSS